MHLVAEIIFIFLIVYLTGSSSVAVRLLYDSVLLSLHLQPVILHSVCDAHL